MEEKTTLFGLTGVYINLMELLQDPDEDQELIVDTMDGIMGEIGEKIDGYAAVIRTVKGKKKMIDEEIKRLQAISDHLDNGVKRMYSKIKESMEAMDLKVVEGKYTTAKIQKNGGLQPLKITGEVPQNFCNVEIKPDNDLIRKALKDGELPFAHLEERGTQLRLV